MSDDDYEKAPAQEWKEASAAKSASRKNASNSEAGEKALELCKRMLEETVEPPAAAVLPCEHDYQPSKVFALTLQCTLCGGLVEDPERPTIKPDDGFSWDNYKDFMQ